MRVLTRTIHLVVIYSISLVLAVLTIFRLCILLIRKGPRKIFGRTVRNEEPECLTDPALGQHGYLHLEEVRIHYVSNGSNEKPLMLLLHGFPESWYSWRFQLKEFSKDYRVLAVDMRGYGDSSKPSGIDQYKLERMVRDVKQIITALDYSSCVLVGHDWGGAVTWAFAGCYPDMVDKAIILNCPHPYGFKKYLLSHLEQFKKSWYMFFFLIPLLPELYINLSDQIFFDIIFLGKKGGILTGATAQADVNAYKYLFQTWSSLTGPINYIRASLMYGIPSRLAQKVEKPVLLLWGCRDLALETGLAEYSEKYAYKITVKYLKECSHWTQMDHPQEVNKYMREFLVE